MTVYWKLDESLQCDIAGRKGEIMRWDGGKGKQQNKARTVPNSFPRSGENCPL